MPHIFIIFLFFLSLASSILKSENIKLKNFYLAENKLPESRLLIDRKKEKIEDKTQIKKQKNNKIKLEKKNQKELKSNKKQAYLFVQTYIFGVFSKNLSKRLSWTSGTRPEH